MKEIVIIRKQKKSDWVSCQSIVDNLEAAYTNSRAVKLLDILYYDDETDDFQIHTIIQNILIKKPQGLVFIDHKPQPFSLILKLNSELKDYRPDLTFHVFGDFVLCSDKWYQSETTLQNFNVKIACASDKHKKLIDSFLIDNSITTIIPFPNNKKTFYFDDTERISTRDELGITDTDFLFIYTGRVSLQKNVLELVKTMSNCLPLSGGSLHFYFAGPFDDIGIPYKGQENPPGAYFQRWVTIEKTIDHTSIKYLNNLGREELRKLYNAADCFVSFSTHNDEDFGMSPSEALMCGLPVILTDWGGYSHFKSISKTHCQLIPIRLEKTRLLPDISLSQKLIFQRMNQKLSTGERVALSKQATELLSIEHVSNLITDLHPTKSFQGFNSHLAKISAIFSTNSKYPFNGPYGNYSDFYFTTYEPYFKATSNGQ